MNMDIQLNIKPELKVQIRIKILHDVIRELAEGFGVLESIVIETIRKGVLDRQLLEFIWIYYLNIEGKTVGRVTMTVDWSKHEILAKSDHGKEFKVDDKNSIKDQIARIYPLLVQHTEDLRKAYDVKQVKTFFAFT